jgi:DNA-directed RNA polymerase subunit E'/Rpb7
MALQTEDRSERQIQKRSLSRLRCATIAARSRNPAACEIELTADRELLGNRSSWSF